MVRWLKNIKNIRLFQIDPIQDDSDADYVEYSYKTLFLKMILIAGAPFTLYYAISSYIIGYYPESALNFICFLTMTLGFVILLRQPEDRTLSPFLIAMPWFYFISLGLIHFSAIGYRGLLNYLPWAFVFPLFASFVLRGRVKYFLIAIYAITITVSLSFGRQGGLSAYLTDSLKDNAIAALLVVCYTSLFFENARMKTQASLVQKQILLHQSEQLYRQANEILKHEIAEREKVENALRESETQCKQLIEYAPAAIYEVDFIKRRLLSVNDLLCEYTGYTREELLTMDPRLLLTRESQALMMERLEKIQNGVEVESNPVYEICNKQGQRRWVMLNVNWTHENGRVVRAKVVAQDITELKKTQDDLRKAHDELETRVRERTRELEKANRELSEEIEERRKAEIALQQEKEKYEDLVNHAPAGIYEVDFIRGRFVKVNDVICDYLGYTEEEMLSMNSLEILTDESRKQFLEKINKLMAGKRVPELVEYQIKKKDGETLWVQLTSQYISENGVLKGARVIAHNVSEQKKAAEEKAALQAQLQQAQKLEAIGTLAGGISHDFNNILAAIIGYTEIAQEEAPPGSQVCHSLEAVLKAGKRARDLVSQILTFSRQAERERTPTQLGAIVGEAINLWRSSLPPTVELRLLDNSDSLIMADPAQISQVVMNLCVNAYQALPDSGGKIEIGLTDVNVDVFSHLRPRLRAGSYVKLTVSDNSRGMEESIMSRIFDPYFTTREVGKGTGLGLAVVQGVARGHNGITTVKSEPGRGATFEVYLPIIEGRGKRTGISGKGNGAGNENLLLVDDDSELTFPGRLELQDLGYRITACASGEEALELFKRRPGRFDLVVTDLAASDMAGVQLARELLKIRPELPIIVCAGAGEYMTRARAAGMGIKAYLEKPLGVRTLAKTIRETLDKGLDRQGRSPAGREATISRA